MTKCNRCKGSGMLRADLLSRRDCSYITHVISCDDCQGKGYRGDETGRVYCSVTYKNERPYGSPGAYYAK